MDAQDEIFKAIEAYEDMTIDALQYSKIGKGTFPTWLASKGARTPPWGEEAEARSVVRRNGLMNAGEKWSLLKWIMEQ